MSNLITNLIIGLSVWFVLSLFIIIFNFSLIKTKIMLKLKKKKDYGVAVEIKDNQSFKIHALPIKGKNIKIKHKHFNINPEDIMISDDFDTKGVVLSENLRTSLNPKSKDNTAIDSVTLNNLIKRAVIDGQYTFYELIEKIKKFAPFVGMIVLGYMAISLFLLFKLTQGGKII